MSKELRLYVDLELPRSIDCEQSFGEEAFQVDAPSAIVDDSGAAVFAIPIDLLPSRVDC